jgi:methylated-DNA-[protein]-cysteine S-methyltransferase
MNQIMLEETIKSGKLSPAMNFNQKVWAITARIPKGKVVTYGDIARALGTKAYRAVGNALNRNPYAPAVPCHRVVGSDGSLTGFAAGVEMKKRLLSEEGVRFATDNRVDLNDVVRHELR